MAIDIHFTLSLTSFTVETFNLPYEQNMHTFVLHSYFILYHFSEHLNLKSSFYWIHNYASSFYVPQHMQQQQQPHLHIIFQPYFAHDAIHTNILCTSPAIHLHFCMLNLLPCTCKEACIIWNLNSGPKSEYPFKR